jgi:hypothetical protein
VSQPDSEKQVHYAHLKTVPFCVQSRLKLPPFVPGTGWERGLYYFSGPGHAAGSNRSDMSEYVLLDISE